MYYYRTDDILDNSKNCTSNFVSKYWKYLSTTVLFCLEYKYRIRFTIKKTTKLLICDDFSFTFSPKVIVEPRKDWLHSRQDAPAVRKCHIGETLPVHTWSIHPSGPVRQFRYRDPYSRCDRTPAAEQCHTYSQALHKGEVKCIHHPIFAKKNVSGGKITD